VDEWMNLSQQYWVNLSQRYSREAFLDYLKAKLEIEGYWEAVGLV
jgi:Ni,Fe-hydrogenase I cytochrome b subunit